MLTQLLTLKSRLGIPESDVRDDVLLDTFIAGMSGRFELECKRSFARVAGATEEFNADDTEIRVPLYPIEADGITAFHLKASETEGWVAQTGVDFLIRRGCVISLSARLGTERQQGRVTYTGGYVLPGATAEAGQTPLPREIEHVILEQLAYAYQNRNRLGLTGVSGDGGSIQQFAQLDLLPNVRAVLANYERWAN